MRNLLAILLLFLLTSTANAQQQKLPGNLYYLGDELTTTSVADKQTALVQIKEQRVLIEQNGTLRAGKAIRNETRYFEFAGMTNTDGQTLECFKPVKKKALAARFPDSMIGKDDSKRYRVLDVVSKDDEAKTVVLVDPVSKVEHTSEISKLKSVEARYVKKWTPEAAAAAKAKREPVAGELIHGEKIEAVWSGKVVKISDGDTATVLNADNEQITIRFNGIDTPESKQAFGTKSKEALGN